MVKLMYCKSRNPLGEVGEIDFSDLSNAMDFINANKSGLLAESAGYTVYTIVEEGQMPQALFNYTR